MKVWLNGQFLDRNDARVSVFDAGFQHAVGLFETMLARNGRVFRPHRHVQRLVESASMLRLTERLRAEPLLDAIDLALAENGLDDARIRLTLTGGDLNLLQSAGTAPNDPTILIVVQPPTPYPDAFFSDGITLLVADGRVNPFSMLEGHKTLSYWERIAALQIAASRGAGEALWLNVSNHLASGSVSNLFLVRDGALFTPIARGEEESGALPAPVLPGITRSTVIELAEAQSRTVSRKMLTIDDLLSADEVFMTNSSWGVLPVVGVERESIGDGGPGPVTMDLRTAWLDLVHAETTIADA